MNISVQEYNQVLDGLRTQLILQRRLNSEAIKRCDNMQFEVQANRRIVVESELTRIRHLNAIEDCIAGVYLPDGHADRTPAYEAVEKLVRETKRGTAKKGKK